VVTKNINYKSSLVLSCAAACQHLAGVMVEAVSAVQIANSWVFVFLKKNYQTTTNV